MPPRVAYWTSAFEPGMEAIANEVALLRQRFPSSIAWGLSHRHWILLSKRRGLCLNPRFHLLFRAAVRVLEPAFQLNHIFGSVGDWFYLQGTRCRPTILTMAAVSPPVQPTLLERVECFVVEYPSGKDCLRRLGIEESRIRLIFPPVDLARFAPRPLMDQPFTVLFASSPDEASWLDARGIPQLLDAAALRPLMRFRLLWRPWGDSEKTLRQWIAERQLQNVDLVVNCSQDMARQYAEAHVTIAPFTDANRSKPAPNSVVESLACGRPVLVTEVIGLADLIREGGAGLVCPATGTALAEQLDRLQAGHSQYCRNARRLAESRFGVEPFLEAYAQLYKEILAA
jgi:glycosyltransferase involved in cell wall biosynthesis